MYTSNSCVAYKRHECTACNLRKTSKATTLSDSQVKLGAVTVSQTRRAGFSANFFTWQFPFPTDPHHRKHRRGSQKPRIPSTPPHRPRDRGRFLSTRPCETSAIFFFFKKSLFKVPAVKVACWPAGPRRERQSVLAVQVGGGEAPLGCKHSSAVGTGRASIATQRLECSGPRRSLAQAPLAPF